MIFSVEMIYVLMGIIVLGCSLYIFTDRTNSRRLTTGSFYLIYSITLMFGKIIPAILHWAYGYYYGFNHCRWRVKEKRTC